MWAPGLSAASSPPAPRVEGRQGPLLCTAAGEVCVHLHCLETPETVHATLLQMGKLSPGGCIEPHSGEEAAPRAGGGCAALTPRPCREVCLPGGLGCRPSQDSQAGLRARDRAQGPVELLSGAPHMSKVTSPTQHPLGLAVPRTRRQNLK